MDDSATSDHRHLFAPAHVGELTAIIPPEMVDAALETGHGLQQRCRHLPSRVIVYLLLAGVLFAEQGRLQVWSRCLITSGDPPVDPLPATFDISVGHDDERGAITEGSHTTAYERQLTRSMAVTARQGLADFVGAAPDSPSLELIRDWVAQLSDEQAIERAGRLEAFRDVSTDSGRERAMRVVDDLLAEVSNFVAGKRTR